MGPPRVPTISNSGFVILNRFGQLWSRTLYPDEQSAMKAIWDKGYAAEDHKDFKIVPASFDIHKAEFDVSDEVLPDEQPK